MPVVQTTSSDRRAPFAGHAIRAFAMVSLALLGAACGDDGTAAIDDAFCHGVTDGVACDDGDACTVDDRCGLGVCQGRPALDCSALDDGACQVGVCDPATVTCVAAPQDDGVTCDDGSLCTGADACLAGTCVGVATDCSPLAGPCIAAACDPATGACGTEVLADEVPCDDGDLCTTAGACQGGACVETAVDCSELASPCVDAVCDPVSGGCAVTTRGDGDACEDGNPCTTAETCAAGVCGGATQRPDGSICTYADLCMLPGECHSGTCSGGPKPCPLPATCEVAVCDGATGMCGVEQAADGAACDDRDACTVGETCTAGVCGDGANQCFCRDQADGTPCNDGQRCTLNDACDAGACLGTRLECGHLDDGSCLTGACEPTTGECVALPLPDGTSCDDGAVCTDDDRCAGGACRGATPDCSELDAVCTVGACTEAAAGCTSVPRANGLPCQDGDPCTGGDVCAGGVCAGGLDACAACQGLAVGATCDDDDPCTTASQCVVVAGQLRCEGAPRDCAGLDADCVIGICDGATGVCTTAARPDGGGCDDGNACTTGDACAAGVCSAAAILMCGAQVATCETSAPNEQPVDASPFPASTALGQPTTVLGGINPASETDWWRLDVPTGHLVTVQTKAHCGSALDSVIGVYDAAGTLLAEDDNSGAGAWSKVSDLLITEDGALLVGVSAYGPSGTGRYLLAVTIALPPPCIDDDSCTCGELTCVRTGPAAGQCVPRMPAANGPNQSPESASGVALGGEVRGALATVDQADWYAVALEADVPVTFYTRNYCGGALETELSVFAADGVTQLAGAVGGGAAGHGLIASFTAPEAGSYLVRVRSAAATVGEYVLTTAALTCATDAACGCGDQVCSGDAAAPGLCVPALDAPGAQTTPAPLELGQRMHGDIAAPYEVDRFSLPVGAGAYDIETVGYCGEATDTRIDVYDASGALLASDDDGGEGFFAGVYGLVVPAVTVLDVRVRVVGPAVGPYLVTARQTAPTP